MTLVAIKGGRGHAQAPEAASYPVDPIAAAGMTSGLPNGITSRQAEMMQVRTSAQGAQGEASAASLSRSADLSIEERNREIALQTARTNKAIKDEMRNRLRFEQASASYNKVTANDMSTWKTQSGGVRVERNVPDAFITSLIAEEEEAAARAAASGEKKRFSLFGGNDDSSGSDGGSFLGSIRAPRLPFLGGGNDGGEAAPTAALPSDNSEPVFAQGSSSRSSSSSPASAPTSRPGVVPMISGAALVDGRSPVNPNQAPANSQQISFADETPEPEKKKSSLFSKIGSASDEDDTLVPTSSGSSGGGGFFGFGKKKTSAPVGTIDASLFPAGSASDAPIGTRLPGGSSVTMASSSDPAVAPSRTVSAGSSGSIELPGQTVEKSRGLSLPKPNLSLPSIPTLTKSASSGGGSASAGYHVVTNTAQFMVYGADRMQSEIRALPAGTTVMVTKPGEQWAGIRLTDGTEGIVQNKNLRPAAGSDSSSAGGEFATSPGQ